MQTSSTIALHPNRIVQETVGAPELVIALRQARAVEAQFWPRSRNFVRIRTGWMEHDLIARGKGQEVRDATSAALPQASGNARKGTRMPDLVEGTQDDDGVPRLLRRERPRYPRGFMADPRKTYRLPTRTDIRPGGDLRDTDLVRANLRSADLRGADLSGADLFHADLTDADLTGANLSGACLHDTRLRRARLVGADLTGADLFNLDLGQATFDGAVLKGASIQFYGWGYAPASMRGADLSGATLFWCTLLGFDLTRANLSGAVVRAPGTWQQSIGEDGGSLSGAVLAGALLDGLVAVRDWPRRANYRRPYPRALRERTFSQATRQLALARAGNRCEQCQSTGRLHVDHVVSGADGGAETIDNAQVLCRKCHVAKTTRDRRERELLRVGDEASAAKARWEADQPARDADLAEWHARKAAWRARKVASAGTDG